MTTYTNVFGGETVPPSDCAYRAVALSADTTFYWPDNTDSVDLMASIMEVTGATASLKMIFPAANEVSTGRDVLVRNVGSETVLVRDSADGAIATVLAGESKYIYITDNSTAAGVWSVFTYGTGTSGADATALDGYGLTVLSSQLNSNLAATVTASGKTIATTDRAQIFVYTGGTASWYLPDPSTVPNGFYFAVSNAGTGTLTIDATTYSGTIDGDTIKQIQPGESCFVCGATSGWYTVGYGRSNIFSFTQLAVDTSVGGTGTITITSAQAQNKMWYFYNTSAGDRAVSIPAVASVYFVRVGAIGAGNTLTFTTGSGSNLAIEANLAYTIFCDGTNVVNATSATAATSVALDDGSAASPAMYFNLDVNTGVYRAGTDEFGVAVGGASAAVFSSTGIKSLAAPLAVAQGGTGAATLTGLVKGNGTGVFTAASPTSDYQPYDVDTAKLDVAQTWVANQTLTNSTLKVKGSSTGVTTFTSANASATDYTATIPAETMEIGFRNIPYSGKTSGSTDINDAGKFVNCSSSGTTTIVGATSYPVGTAITFVNKSGGSHTITISTDTMYLAGTGTTASKTLANNGEATALKYASGYWIISGVGLT